MLLNIQAKFSYQETICGHIILFGIVIEIVGITTHITWLQSKVLFTKKLLYGRTS